MIKKIFISLIWTLVIYGPLFSQTSAYNFNSDEIIKRLNLKSDKTETVKDFDADFVDQLFNRGNPLVYTRSNSSDFEYIGMPIGGICAGQLYLGGDGKLWFWDIFNTNYKIGQLKGVEAYQYPYKRSEPDQHGALDIFQGFAIKVEQGEHSVVKTLDRDGIENIEFIGQYPIGTVNYSDDELPVDITLEAYSPFISLDVDNSSYPATILSFKVRNTSGKTVNVDLAGWLENAVCIETREQNGGKLVNQIKGLDNGNLQLACTAKSDINPEKLPDANYDYGSMALTLFDEGNQSRGIAKIDINKLANGAFTSSETKIVEQKFGKDDLVGALSKSMEIEAGKNANVIFLLTWHFPNSRVNNKTEVKTKYYNKRFKNAFEVSDHICRNFDELSEKTKLWRDTWYDSSLPYWFLDRTFLNTSILASSTSHMFEDGRFYGFEGGYQGRGTCTHVWGYVQAMGRLFPQLEISLREHTDFVPYPKGALRTETGIVEYRGRYNNQEVAVDGQSGIIMRSYLCHLMSPDYNFLNRNYESIKIIMNGLIAARDADHDGILTGPQHNTLDADWYGKVTWLSLHYDAALLSMSKMANEMRDKEYASYCRDLSQKGRKYIKENLFNGEYFYHKGDPEHPKSPGIYTGCEYSQLLGQSWAYQVGLGTILDPEKVTSALKSLWKYNFTTDVGPFRKAHSAGRWFAMPGEGGVIACTWPYGGSEVLSKGNSHFAAYNNECQNGYEYACTSLMMWHGMPNRSLAHIWYMHNNRYHGAKRNPWCEVEWGIHYSRSMASYGNFIAACGFEYHGPKGYMAFSPKFSKNNFRAPFIAAEGWGTFSQKKNEIMQKETLELKSGVLQLKTLAFDLPAGRQARQVNVTIDGKKLKSSYRIRNGNRLQIQFTSELKMKQGEKMIIEVLFN